MSMTPEQKKAIEADGCDILVSASAGSGKTFVMIGRIIRLILEGKADVGEILAVTFTNLAASEMKERLKKALEDGVRAGGSDRERLLSQLSRVSAASVSTLHSFCANFLRAYFFEAGLDPRFTVIDEAEADVLRDECADELFEELFEAGDEGLADLAALLAPRRKTDQLRSVVIAAHKFFAAEPDPDKAMTDRLEWYSPEAYRRMRAAIFADVSAEAEALGKKYAAAAAAADESGVAAYASYCRAAADGLVEISRADAPETALRALGAWSLRRPSVKKSGDGADRAAALRERLDALKDAFDKLKTAAEPLAEDPTEGMRRLAESGRAAEELARLVSAFGAKYAARKSEDAKLDFSDLEHVTLRLLENEEIRKEAAGRFRYVFADEYQDVNGAQERILSRLSDGNLFMVGDLKQSIYGFRGCDPSYFAEKFRAFRGGAGEAALLNGNFRSSDAVLAFVNRVFSRIMTEETAGVDYARDGAMTGGGLYGAHAGRTSIRIVPKSEEPRPERTPGIYSVRGAELECGGAGDAARAVAEIVREELGKTWFDIKDPTGPKEKPVTPGDVVVLARTSAGIERAAAALAEAGIPVSAERKIPITAYPEIAALLDFMRLLCSAEQDAALVSVLLSPFGGFTEEELRAVRNAHPSDNFRTALRAYAAEGADELAGRIAAFYDWLAACRDRADFLPADDLLGRLIEEKGFDLFYSARDGGEDALRRIRRLLAEGETAGGRLGVAELLERLERREGEITLSEASGSDGVRLMTVHSSKGLEFPVVVIADASSSFIRLERPKEVVVHRETGIAMKHYDRAARTKEDNLLRKYTAFRTRREAVREEMRVFYVALTRAKYALHVVCSSPLGNPEGTRDVFAASSFSDFLSDGDAEIVEAECAAGCAESGPRRVLAENPDPDLEREIAAALSFRYPFEAEIALPLKSTVTKLAESGEYYRTTELFGETSAERGTAFHAALEFLARRGALCSAPEKDEIAGALLDAVREERIDEAARQTIDPAVLARALALPVFAELRGYEIYPEQPFTAFVPARDAFPDLPLADSGENVLVQGVVDLLAVRDGEAVILDYKLTSVAREEDVRAKYRAQLLLYRRAVEETLGLKVTRLSIVDLLRAAEIPVF